VYTASTVPAFRQTMAFKTNPPVPARKNATVHLPSPFCQYSLPMMADELRDALSSGLRLEIWNRDAYKTDTCLGTATIDVKKVADANFACAGTKRDDNQYVITGRSGCIGSVRVVLYLEDAGAYVFLEVWSFTFWSQRCVNDFSNQQMDYSLCNVKLSQRLPLLTKRYAPVFHKLANLFSNFWPRSIFLKTKASPPLRGAVTSVNVNLKNKVTVYKTIIEEYILRRFLRYDSQFSVIVIQFVTLVSQRLSFQSVKIDFRNAVRKILST